MLLQRQNGIKTLLCLGAHADDIEIGCGGAVLSLLEAQPGINVFWVVLSANAERRAEAQRSAELFLSRAGEREIIVKEFRDRFFPYDGASIKEYFDELGTRIEPDLVFTHRREDQHQDHRLVNELTWNTFRDHRIFEYEIPKYEGDLGAPNVFVPLDLSACDRKVETIMESFPSQHHRAWFTADLFRGLVRLRGVECNSPSGLAEGFHCRKLTVAF